MGKRRGDVDMRTMTTDIEQRRFVHMEHKKLSDFKLKRKIKNYIAKKSRAVNAAINKR